MRYSFLQILRSFIAVSIFLINGYVVQIMSAQTVNFHSKGTTTSLRATDIRSIKFGTRITVSSTISSSTSSYEFSAVDSITVTPVTSATLAFDLTRLPFGDAKILRRDRGQTQAVLGSLWLCAVPANGTGNSNARDWTNSDGTWDFTRKPTVDGSVMLPSVFNVMFDASGNRVITTNSIPSTPTGIFPIDPASIAYRYDRNPNGIEPHNMTYILPVLPQVAARPSCLTFGPSGISLTGGHIYHASSTLATDASAYEMLDKSGGQPDGTKMYHYHFLTQNHLNALESGTSGHSALMGYMNDGFGIYGPRGENGSILSSKDLDECHGHTHPVLWDGKMVNLYHYHWTYDFPYNIACYKGTPKY